MLPDIVPLGLASTTFRHRQDKNDSNKELIVTFDEECDTDEEQLNMQI